MLDFQKLIWYNTKAVDYGPLVKWLRLRPLTAASGVRISYGSPLEYNPNTWFVIGALFGRTKKTPSRTFTLLGVFWYSHCLHLPRYRWQWPQGRMCRKVCFRPARKPKNKDLKKQPSAAFFLLNGFEFRE